MRWIRTPAGDQAHAVPRAFTNRTLCGLFIEGAAIAAAPGFENRCLNCDREWRRMGRTGSSRPKPNPRVEYKPKHKFTDWE
jgi:hypothetical protein